jgi:hypothetical protein
MTGHGAKFGRKKEEAIIALLAHRNVEEAAKSIGVAPKTLFRWMQVPEFDAATAKPGGTHLNSRSGDCSGIGRRSHHSPQACGRSRRAGGTQSSRSVLHPHPDREGQRDRRH